MKEITFKINGEDMTVPEGTTILEAARINDIDIPTLCYLKDINEIGACRMCLVEIAGARALQAACVYPVANGIEVLTNSPKVRKARKVNLELILSNHNRECTICVRSKNCELQALAKELGVSNIPFEGEKSGKLIDNKSTSVVRDESKCILCKRCVAVCATVQNVAVLGSVGRGFTSKVQPVFNKSLAEVGCINCGQCIINCPVGALSEKSDIQRVWDALEDKTKTVFVQAAPAVRAALGEEFGYPMGTPVTGKMAAAFRRLGFDKIFDTGFGADITIMEEAPELINRITNGGVLPMITSCSPGWITYAELYHPEILKHLSTCKSPQNITGALIKSHYAETNGLDPKDIVVVSVMPCTAKKYELKREELKVDGIQDVDISITTRELARMIKEARLIFDNLPDEEFDPYYGEYTGAGVIFGTAGGVMEACIRTGADILNKTDVQKIDYEIFRGVKGIKTATVDITPDLTVKIMLASGGKNIQKVMEQLKAGELDDVHMIELMACPGGCVNGGGQPIVSAKVKMDVDIGVERAKALYESDSKILKYRKSHQSPSVIRIYDEFLGEPNSEKAHHLLHTTFCKKPKLV